MRSRRVIALMMGTAGLRTDYQGYIRAGVERRCIEHDIDLWVYSGRNDWRPSGPQGGQIYELVTPENIDGIIVLAGVIACFLDVNQLCEKLRQLCPVPICSIGLRVNGIPSIAIDNRTGMESVVSHLVVAHERMNFAFIAGPRGHEESEERLDAARQALIRAGRRLRDDAVVYGNFSLESGALSTRELLSRIPNLDAIVAANDDMAAGALQALNEVGRGCPAEIAVAGFDDAPSSRICIPSLTTARQPAYDLGLRAAEAVISMWQGELCPASTTLRTEAVIRESCGCNPLSVAIGDTDGGVAPEMAKSLEAELVVLLSSLIGEERMRLDWAKELLSAVHSEALGHAGALRMVIQRLVDEASHADSPLYDLLLVISFLRKTSSRETESAAVDEAFHDALFQIGQAMHRREARRRLQDGFLMDELRLSWERLATTLSLGALRDVLLRDLPRFWVQNAIVAVFAPGDTSTLVPLACLVDGQVFEIDPEPYPAIELKPGQVPYSKSRCSFAVMPLTFEWEPLGVALLELPVQEAYMVLREQIGSAIKTVRLHETLMQQQERLKLQAQSEQQAATERLRTLGLIAGGVAHDLNNVLGPLVALPEAMQKDLAAHAQDVPQSVYADLDTVQEAAQRASVTIRDLLTLGRAVDAPRQTYDLNRVFYNVRRPLSQLAARADGIELRFIESERPLLVEVSREHLVRAVSNLVVNAADAMSAPGAICVRLSERKLATRLDGVEPVEPGHYAVIEVEDSGCGIPREHLSRVLEPFFSSKMQSGNGGTGLGLAIVHQIVRQSRGYVQVTSHVGKGTTFALYLPLVLHGKPVESAPPSPAAGGVERILVVDDERVQLRTAQRILRQLGYFIVTAESGEAALVLHERHLDDAPFHLVILDMLMPGLNGLATLKELRRRNPSQKVLIASGYAPEQLSREAKENGVDWLAKPYNTAALASAVRRALRDTVQPAPGTPNPRPSA